MSAEIKAMYRRAGMKPPKGNKGIHTKKFHKTVTSIGTDGKNPYAIAMAKLGPGKAVKAGHRKTRMRAARLRKGSK